MALARKSTRRSTSKKLTAAKKKVVQNSANGKLLSPGASSTSAINYYGTRAKARNAAYGRVMAFAAESQKKHASR